MVDGRSRMRSARRKAKKAESQWDVMKRAEIEAARKKFRKRCVVCNTHFYIDEVKPDYRSRFFVQTKTGKKWFCLSCVTRNPRRIIQMVLIVEAIAQRRSSYCNREGDAPRDNCGCTSCVAARVLKLKSKKGQGGR